MSKKKNNSVEEFLKKDDPNLEALKKKYFNEANMSTSYVPPAE